MKTDSLMRVLRSLLTCCVVYVSFAASLPPAHAADRPNVLVLIADDQRADCVGAVGAPGVITPNIDSLARRGFAATSAYCLGSNMGAVCQPSRNMLLSGRTYFRWADPAQGLSSNLAPPDVTTLPAVFRGAGYETYHHGKRGNTAPQIHKQFNHSHYLDDFDARWNMRAGQQVVDDAIGFLSGREGDKPWLMWLEFATPHDPRAASAAALRQYDPATIPLPPNIRPSHPFDNGAVLVRDEWTALWPRTPQRLADQWHDYLATITTLDANIGRLIEHLREAGTLENTIVVFTSDHGLAMGSHGLMGKQNVYEAGMKAPMVLAGPGVAQGRADDPVYLLDLYPTLCELTGVTAPKDLDGRSFAGMVSKGERGPRESVMLAYTDTQRAVRKGDWKLIHYPKVSRSQLFDLKADPHEMIDLIGETSHAARVEQLSNELLRLQEQNGDRLELGDESVKWIHPDSNNAFDPPEYELIGEDLLPPRYRDAQRQHDITFEISPIAGGYITAIAVGVRRGSMDVVTGLRLDMVDGKDEASGGRRTVIFGDSDSRWLPLLDQLKPKNQPVAIFGQADEAVRTLGIELADGKRMPPLDLSIDGASPFENRLPAKNTAGPFVGFAGAIRRDAEGTAITSIRLLSPSELPDSEER